MLSQRSDTFRKKGGNCDDIVLLKLKHNCNCLTIVVLRSDTIGSVQLSIPPGSLGKEFTS